MAEVGAHDAPLGPAPSFSQASDALAPPQAGDQVQPAGPKISGIEIARGDDVLAVSASDDECAEGYWILLKSTDGTRSARRYATELGMEADATPLSFESAIDSEVVQYLSGEEGGQSFAIRAIVNKAVPDLVMINACSA